MGVDIHVVIEERYESIWVTAINHTMPIPRNYPLFARIANVRNSNNVPYIAEPRGLPSDIHPMTRDLFPLDWTHDHTWLSADEALSLRGISDCWDNLVAYVLSVNYWHEIRFVIGFDS